MRERGPLETGLWLIRHPEPDASFRGRCYGSLDVALSPHGRQNAEQIAQALASVRFAAIYASPRTRCTYLANLIASNRRCGVEVVEDLRELDFGDFEGRTYDEIAQLYPETYARWMEHPTETAFPKGETFQAMRARVLNTRDQLVSRHSGQSFVCVTHGGVIRILIAEAFGIPPAGIFSVPQRYGAINRIRYSGGPAAVELIDGVGVDFCPDSG